MSETSKVVLPNPHEVLEKRYEKLFQDGKLVQIHVRKWGMECSLNKEDLNMGQDVNLPAIFKLGKKLLIDPKVDSEVIPKFQSIEAKARKFLENNAFPFPIAQTHFVPRKLILAVTTKLMEYREQYLANTDRFVEKYETYRDETLKLYPDYSQYLRPYYPEAIRVRSKFSFDLDVFEISFPRKLKQLDVSDLVIQAEAKQEVKQAYEAEMERQYQAALSRMNSFVTESASALRGQVVSVFDTIMGKIRDGEVVSTTNLKSVRNIVKNFNSLDFFDDKEVKTRMNQVIELLDSTQSFKDNKEAIQRLSSVLGQVLEVTRATTDIDSLTGEYFRQLDV